MNLELNTQNRSQVISPWMWNPSPQRIQQMDVILFAFEQLSIFAHGITSGEQSGKIVLMTRGRMKINKQMTGNVGSDDDLWRMSRRLGTNGDIMMKWRVRLRGSGRHSVFWWFSGCGCHSSFLFFVFDVLFLMFCSLATVASFFQRPRLSRAAQIVLSVWWAAVSSIWYLSILLQRRSHDWLTGTRGVVYSYIFSSLNI